MREDTRQEVLRLVDNRAGDSFRAAASYSAEDRTLPYGRDDVATDDRRDVLSADDVATDDRRDALSALLERMREREPIVPEGTYAGIGRTQATVELRGETALIHVPEGDAEGVLISFDRAVVRGLGQFVTRRAEVLAERR